MGPEAHAWRSQTHAWCRVSQGHPLADPRLLTLATGTNSLMNSFCTSHTGPHWSLELVQNSQDTCGHQVLSPNLERVGSAVSKVPCPPMHCTRNAAGPRKCINRSAVVLPADQSPSRCLCNQLQSRVLTAAQRHKTTQHNTPAASWAGCPANP